jgi:hypothetical protein
LIVNIDAHRWSYNMNHYITMTQIITYHLGRVRREKDEGRGEKGGGSTRRKDTRSGMKYLVDR